MRGGQTTSLLGPRAPEHLEEVVRAFPTMLEKLGQSYRDLEARAMRVEEELCQANAELESKVHELDVLKGNLEAVLESLPCGVVVRDVEGNFKSANKKALAILEQEREELLGALGSTLLGAPASDGETRPHALASGRRVMLSTYSSDVHLADGSVNGSVTILDDRTEEHELSERLHAADKMAALGTLAAGVAHEIRNPLTAVKGFAALLEERLQDDETARRWSSLISRGALEADGIIENMLSFGSPERLRSDRIDAHDLLERVRAMVWPAGLPEGLALRTETDVAPFRGDEVKLRHALRNLVVNASEAMGSEGEIHVSILDESGVVCLRVADSGPGIPAEYARCVLDPFFTTRPDGTGLGLALVSTIARLHEGSIEIIPNSLLGGAEINLRIPHRPVTPATQIP